MGLLALAMAPGIAICLYIYFADKHHKEPIWMLLMALLIPILFHGTYDFFLFLKSGNLLTLGAIASFILALYLSFKAIRKKQIISKLFHEEKNRINSQDEQLY